MNKSPFRPWRTEALRAGVHHVTFGTAEYAGRIRRLRLSAAAWGITSFRAYRPLHRAFRQALAENPEIMRAPRGVGFWLWKPYIILDALRRLPDGGLLFYSDADWAYAADPAPLFSLAADHDIVLFESRQPEWTQRAYTKRDCFVLLDADTPAHWDRHQLEAGFQLYRAGAAARGFVGEWLAAMRDPRVLTDRPNTCGLPDLEGFIDHRHDQSVLTILAVRHGIETFRVPDTDPDPLYPSSAYPRIFVRQPAGRTRRRVRLLKRIEAAVAATIA